MLLLRDAILLLLVHYLYMMANVPFKSIYHTITPIGCITNMEPLTTYPRLSLRKILPLYSTKLINWYETCQRNDNF